MYGKIFASMFQGSLYGQWEAIVTFTVMIVLCDKDGEVDMTPEALAAATSIPLDIIKRGIASLEMPDPESRTPDESGRRIVRVSDDRSWGWRITNYAHYRAMRTAEERREYFKQHKRKQRAAKRQPDSTAAQQSPPLSTGGPQIPPIAVGSKQEVGSSKQEALKAHAHASLTAFCERMPNLSKDRIFTMGIGQRDPDAWGASMLAILDGMRGSTPTPDELAVALTEMAATSALPSPANVRAFLRRAKSDAQREVLAPGGRRKSGIDQMLAESGGNRVLGE